MGVPVQTSILLILALLPELPTSAEDMSPSREEVVAAMQPYDGPSTLGVDRSTLTGKVMCGYQGWYTTQGDSSGRGWRHYQTWGQFKSGFCNIDLWPDMSDYE